MKKATFIVLLCGAIIFTYSCGNNTEKKRTHTHGDGSVHDDHDTSKPVQQQFNVTDTTKKDTTGHTHPDGTKHTH